MADVIICKNCGKENEKNTMYCYNCHEPLNENTPPLPLIMEWLKDK